LSEYISPKHADLVAAYKRTQESRGTNLWPDRPEAPYRIKTFVVAGPAGDSTG
jgi:hypothetical protein